MAVRSIIADPHLLAEVRDRLPALKAVAQAHAGPDGVRAVISRRFVLYPQPERGADEWAAWWADYIDVLAEVPLASLEAGMRAHVADPEAEFLPKPGRLKELAFLAPCRALARYYRASMVIAQSDQPPRIASPAADPAEVKAMAAELGAKLRRPPARELPSIAGKTDEGGLTPQMRELLSRQRDA